MKLPFHTQVEGEKMFKKLKYFSNKYEVPLSAISVLIITTIIFISLATFDFINKLLIYYKGQ